MRSPQRSERRTAADGRAPDAQSTRPMPPRAQRELQARTTTEGGAPHRRRHSATTAWSSKLIVVGRRSKRFSRRGTLSAIPSRRPNGSDRNARPLLRNSTAQRCQRQPSTRAIALRSRWCASEAQSLTPARPRAFSANRNSVRNASVSASPTSGPSASRTPPSCTASAITSAFCRTPPRSRTRSTFASETTIRGPGQPQSFTSILLGRRSSSWTGAACGARAAGAGRRGGLRPTAPAGMAVC